MEYEVLCRCVSVTSETYHVEADSKEEAIEKVNAGEFNALLDSQTDDVKREDFEVSEFKK